MIAPAQGGQQQWAADLELLGARIITWPTFQIVEPDDLSSLDEAIDNLFGYDWLVFETAQAAHCFLKRVGSDFSELDAVRICSTSQAASEFESAQIHLDIVSHRTSSAALFQEIENYVGTSDSLRRLNFLVPGSNSSGQPLKERLEDAGARVDVPSAFRVQPNDNLAFAQLRALLQGGGIDWLVICDAQSIVDLSLLLSTNDLAQALADLAIACLNDESAAMAATFDLPVHLKLNEQSMLAEAIARSL